MSQHSATQNEMYVLTRLRAYLSVEKRKTFTADDLYSLGLVRKLPKPRDKTVGGWFHLMQRLDHIWNTGKRVASQRTPNKGRSIIVWNAYPKELSKHES